MKRINKILTCVFLISCFSFMVASQITPIYQFMALLAQPAPVPSPALTVQTDFPGYLELQNGTYTDQVWLQNVAIGNDTWADLDNCTIGTGYHLIIADDASTIFIQDGSYEDIRLWNTSSTWIWGDTTIDNTLGELTMRDNSHLRLFNASLVNFSSIELTGSSYLEITDESSIQSVGTFKMNESARLTATDTTFRGTDTWWFPSIMMQNDSTFTGSNVTIDDVTTFFLHDNSSFSVDQLKYIGDDTPIANFELKSNASLVINNSRVIADQIGFSEDFRITAPWALLDLWYQNSSVIIDNSNLEYLEGGFFGNSSLEILDCNISSCSSYFTDSVTVSVNNTEVPDTVISSNLNFDKESDVVIFNCTLDGGMLLDDNGSATIIKSILTDYSISTDNTDCNSSVTLINTTQQVGALWFYSNATLNATQDSILDEIYTFDNVTIYLDETSFDLLRTRGVSQVTIMNSIINSTLSTSIDIQDNSSLALSDSEFLKHAQIQSSPILPVNATMVIDNVLFQTLELNLYGNSTLDLIDSRIIDPVLYQGSLRDSIKVDILNSTIPRFSTTFKPKVDARDCTSNITAKIGLYFNDYAEAFFDNCTIPNYQLDCSGNANLTVYNSTVSGNGVQDDSSCIIQDSIIIGSCGLGTYALGTATANLTLINCSGDSDFSITTGEYTGLSVQDVYNFTSLSITENSKCDIDNISFDYSTLRSLKIGRTEQNDLVEVNITNVTNPVRLQIYPFSKLRLENLTTPDLTVETASYQLSGTDHLLQTNESRIQFSSVTFTPTTDEVIFVTGNASFLLTDYTSDLLYITLAGSSIGVIQNCTIPDFEVGGGPSQVTQLIDSEITHGVDIQFGSRQNLIISNSTLHGQVFSMSSHLVEERIEDSLIDGFIWILSGDYLFVNTSIQDAGFLFLKNDYPGIPFTLYAMATLIDSNCTELRTMTSSNITASNSSFDSASILDQSSGIFVDSTILDLIVGGTAHCTLNSCYVEEHSFSSTNLTIYNTTIIDAAPILDDLPNTVQDPETFFLNWTSNPGENFTGLIKNYTIYRANTSRTASAPNSSDYNVVGYIEFPNPTLVADTSFFDTLLNQSSTDYEGQKLWYKIEIIDEGNNRVNSTVKNTLFEGQYEAIEATITYDPLTTYDNVSINIFITRNDVNKDGTADVGMVILNYSTFYSNSSIFNFSVVLNGSSWELIEDVQYQFNLSASYCESVIFFVTVNTTTAYAPFNLSFDSRVKYGDNFTIAEPDIRFSDVIHPLVPKIIETTTLTFTITVSEAADYVENVTVYYRFNTQLIKGVWQTGIFTYNDTEKKFTFIFPSFTNLNYESVDYYINYFDIAGNENKILGDASAFESYTIYPTFPAFYLSDVNILFIVILGSSIVGLVLGSSYLVFKRQSSLESKKELKQMQDKLAILMAGGTVKGKKLREAGPQAGLIMPDVSSSEIISANVSKFNILYFAGLGGLVGCTSIAMLLVLNSDFIYSSLLLLVAMFLAFYVYVVWTYRSTKHSIRKEKFSMWLISIDFVHIIIFMAVTFLLLSIGSNIPWFNYYIVQQSGSPMTNLLIIQLPSLYIKIISVVFSTLVAFTLSVYWDIRRSIRDTHVYQKQNANISLILYSKEEMIKKTFSRINYKIIIFLVLLGISLLPLSADGFVSILPTALMFIAPAFLIFLLFFLFGFFQKSKLDPFGLILEPSKVCPSCNFMNVQSSQYCGKCQAQLIIDQQVFTKTMFCKDCGAINPVQFTFCKACGKELKGKEKSTKMENLPSTF